MSQSAPQSITTFMPFIQAQIVKDSLTPAHNQFTLTLYMVLITLVIDQTLLAVWLGSRPKPDQEMVTSRLSLPVPELVLTMEG